MENTISVNIEVYEKLRQRFDKFGAGMEKPEQHGGEPGSDIELLRSMYTEHEAEVALHIPYDTFATAEEIYNSQTNEQSNPMIRKVDLELLSRSLEIMAKKGIIFRRKRDGRIEYILVPLMIGVLEYQGGRLDSGYWEQLGAFFPSLAANTFSRGLPVMRVLPKTDDNVKVNNTVVPYDDIMSLLDQKEKFAVSECTCRLRPMQFGEPCNKSLETCMTYDEWADFYANMGIGRYITREEAKEIIRRNEREGLVTLAIVSKDIEMTCACCPCHCAILNIASKTDSKDRELFSNYYLEQDKSTCSNCKSCVKRCPMNACQPDDNGNVTLLDELCIGCGVCLNSCPSKSRVLKRKEQVFEPEQTCYESYVKMGEFNEQKKVMV